MDKSVDGIRDIQRKIMDEMYVDMIDDFDSKNKSTIASKSDGEELTRNLVMESFLGHFTTGGDGEVKDSEYEGITSKVKDQQRARNMSFDELPLGALSGLDPKRAAHGLKIKNNKKFNDWFNTYSFAYVPSFAKTLIRPWAKAAYLAALGKVK